MDIPKIVEVIAADWAIYHGVQDLPSTFDPVEIRIVGYLLEDTPEYISLAFEYLGDSKPRPEVRIVLSIPRICIKSMKELTANASLI